MSRKLLAVMAVLAVVGLAACGSDDTAGSTARDSSTIKVENTSLGDVLVDGSGRSLYLFTSDGDNVNSMECDAACLKLWPPLKGTPEAGDGADANLIGTTTGEGAGQATYGGHPLYYYAKDAKAGDVKGQGVDNIWYVLDAKGEAITETPEAPAPGGY